MATLTELRALFGDSDLQEKVEAALIVSVQATLSGTPTTAQQKYAAYVFDNTRQEARKALMAVLAANNGATVSAIQGADDATIQSAVDSVVPALSAAHNV